METEMRLVKFTVLQNYVDEYSNIDQVLPRLNLGQLYDLSAELNFALANTATWLNIMLAGRRKIRPNNQRLISNSYNLLSAATHVIRQEIVLVEIAEEDEADWEENLYPQEENSQADYDYGLLSPYEGEDFSDEMDETWYPTPIWS